MIEGETMLLGQTGQLGVEDRFRLGREFNVLDPSTHGAQQMVVMPREHFAQLEPAELVNGDDLAHHPRSLENGEISVHRALRQRGMI